MNVQRGSRTGCTYKGAEKCPRAHVSCVLVRGFWLFPESKGDSVKNNKWGIKVFKFSQLKTTVANVNNIQH
jgi:hypothetical protein